MQVNYQVQRGWYNYVYYQVGRVGYKYLWK